MLQAGKSPRQGFSKGYTKVNKQLMPRIGMPALFASLLKSKGHQAAQQHGLEGSSSPGALAQPHQA